MGDQATLEARLEELEPQHTMAVRHRRPMATVDVGALMDTAMSALGAALGRTGVAPAGPPYARYHEWGGETADVEIGFPTGVAVAGLPALAEAPEGEVGRSTLPGGRVARTVHRGPYPELGAAYGRLHDWIHDQGEEEGPGPWESYLDNPSDVEDVSTLRTEILWPVAAR